MKLTHHSANEYAEALMALLPPGAAWEWPKDGTGYAVVLASAQELARLDESIQSIADTAIERHHPKTVSWHISEYQRVAEEALGSDTHAAAVQVSHLVQPARIGSRVGDGLWSERSRYFMFVRYDRSVDPEPLRRALEEFKQAHVYLWFEVK